MIMIDHNGGSLIKTAPNFSENPCKFYIMVLKLTMLNMHTADIPKDEGHRTARLCNFLFSIIPYIPVPVNPSSPISIYTDSIATDIEPSMMI